jgi:hypothetical protein
MVGVVALRMAGVFAFFLCIFLSSAAIVNGQAGYVSTVFNSSQLISQFGSASTRPYAIGFDPIGNTAFIVADTSANPDGYYTVISVNMTSGASSVLTNNFNCSGEAFVAYSSFSPASLFLACAGESVIYRFQLASNVLSLFVGGNTSSSVGSTDGVVTIHINFNIAIYFICSPCWLCWCRVR